MMKVFKMVHNYYDVKLVADRKEAVQKEVDECSAVALKTDIWTDRRQHSYMASRW